MRRVVWIRYGPYAFIPIIIAVYAVMTGRFCPTCPTSLAGSFPPSDAGGGSATTIRGIALTGLDGKPLRLEDYVGEPMLIDVWATWCGPCRRQRQVLAELEDQGTAKLRVIAASVDDDPATVRKFVRQHPSQAVEAMATHELMDAVGGVEALPTLVWVDARGRIRDVTVGLISAEQIRQRLRDLR